MHRSRSERPRRPALRFILTIALVAMVAVVVPATSVHALEGIYHAPYGNDDLYSTEPTERAPRDPMEADEVILNITTWTVAPGQSVWVTWTKNGEPQDPIGAEWDYNSGNNSYWQASLGSFERGDQISYTVRADSNGTGERAMGPFDFTVTSWSHVTDVIGHTDNGDSVDVRVGDSAGDFDPAVRFSFPTTDSFQSQIAPTGAGLDIAGSSDYLVTETSAEIRIATDDLVLEIQKSPYRLSVYEGNGTALITRQYDPEVSHNIGWASDGETTVTKIQDHFLSLEGERFEGFGERYDRLDHRGNDVHNYVYNQYLDQGTHERTYLSVPFYLNSSGYGIYLPSTRYSVFNLHTQLDDMAGFTLDTGGQLDSTLDYHLFTGSQGEIIDRYTEFSGRPLLPPKWAFGPWMSANEWNTQDEVENELENIELHDIPHSVMVLEQWSDEATFYAWHGAEYEPTDGAGRLTYDDLSFPSGTAWRDPAAMVQQAHDQNIRVLLWQIPVLKENFDFNPSVAPPQHINDRVHAQEEGYVVEDGSGNPYRVPTGHWFGDSMVPDFTNDDATQWWMSKRQYLIDEIGIDGFKTDGGEIIFGRDVQFSDNRDGAEMHNEYPNSYTEAYNSYLQELTGGDGTLFSRAGTAGAQSNSIFWAGDQASSWQAYQEALRAGISAGQSGVPFWAWDMAGFTGDFPSAELYLRSAAQAVFSPVMQYHSEQADPSPSEARTPWNVQQRTGDEAVIPTFRNLANIRMNLLPYIYTEAVHAAETGEPMMRAMSHEFPDDPQAAHLDQQYMFGEQLLVAPVTEEGAGSTQLYVPAGEWYDFWNGGRFTGPGVKTYYAGLDTIPVYARAGAIIPLDLNDDYQLGGGVGNDVDQHTNLTFRIYPGGNSAYDYYDDSTETHRTIRVTEDWGDGRVGIDVPALGEVSTLQVASTPPGSVTVDGAEVPMHEDLEAFREASQGWYWDSVQHLTYVKLAPSDQTRIVNLDGVDKAAYEAEFAEGVGTGVNNDHADYTGTGFVDQFSTAGNAVDFQINASEPGQYIIRLRYSNGGEGPATRTVWVDGDQLGTIELPLTGGWGQWADASVDVELDEGAHLIRISYEQDDAVGVNLDHLVLARPWSR